MERHSSNRLLTGQEVALSFGVTPVTIQRWGRAGILPAVRLSSRCIRYRQSAVNRLLSERGGVPRAK